VDADPKEKIVEFRVTPDALVPVGTQLLVTHFVVVRPSARARKGLFR